MVLQGDMNPIVACGVDIIEVERLRTLRERYGDRFLRRVYCGSERGNARAHGDGGQFLAGRFAAKEAVLKVLGCGLFSGVRLTDIEIRTLDTGEPQCVLRGRARGRAEARGISRILISISHCDAYAVAHAIGVGGGAP